MQPAEVAVPVAEGVRLHVRHWPAAAASADADDAAANAAAVGPPYLLVHGLSSNARLWDGVAGHLHAAGATVYAVDLRSHGESDAPEDGYDTATAARDLAVLCGALDLRDLVVAGQSWGGNVVVRLAARHPELVGALALVDGGWIDLSLGHDSWEECEAALRPPAIDGHRPAELRAYIRAAHSDWSPAAIDATLANLRIEPDGTLSRRLSIPRHMRIMRSMWDDPPWPDLAKIDVPVLLMPSVPRGEQEAARKRDQVDRAAAALAQPTIREYVGADHDLHAQHPEQVAADLMGLASRLAAEGAP